MSPNRSSISHYDVFPYLKSTSYKYHLYCMLCNFLLNNLLFGPENIHFENIVVHSKNNNNKKNSFPYWHYCRTILNSYYRQTVMTVNNNWVTCYWLLHGLFLIRGVIILKAQQQIRNKFIPRCKIITIRIDLKITDYFHVKLIKNKINNLVI